MSKYIVVWERDGVVLTASETFPSKAKAMSAALYKESMEWAKGTRHIIKLREPKVSKPQPEPNDDSLLVYTDGSCLVNPGGAGGWAYVTNDRRAGSSGAKESTNNRAEVMAAILALESLPETELTIVSDSQYLVNTMTRGWKRSKNVDLWERLDQAIEGKVVRWKWVKGHAGNPLNEQADKLAGQAARLYAHTVTTH